MKNTVQSIRQRYSYAIILLKQLVKTDFKLRYQNSFLGYLWSLLKPLMLFIVMYLVFVKVLHVDYGVKNSGAYLFLGIVIWSFFVEVTTGSVGAIVGRGDLLRKLSFPRYVLVITPGLSALINFIINMSVVIIFMIIGGVSINLYILYAPLLFIELFIFCLAIGFFLSALFVKLRDIGHIWDVIIQILFYATPIFFPVTLAPLRAQKIIMLSPLSQIIQDFRYIMISPKTVTITHVFGGNIWARLIPITITVVLFIMSTSYFRARSKYFAEEI